MDRSTLIPVDWKFEYHILTLHKQKYVEANSSKRKPLQMIIVSPKTPALDGKTPVQDTGQASIRSICKTFQ